MHRVPAAGVLACALLATGSASAFTYESPATDGCHERISADALRDARRAGLAPPIAMSRDERALADDVPFELADDLHDYAAVALLIGTRENDLRGRGPTDLDLIAQLHGDDGVQREHCLRRTGEDGHAGTVAAVAACRAFIREKVSQALDALDARSVPDPSNRTEIELTLAVRGEVRASFPTFYLRLGEALHALQDSFTHTFRTADGREITVVLNWIDHVGRALDEPRDGPPHLEALDKCDDRDDLRRKRREWATTASSALVRLALDPTRDRGAKLAALDALLDEWLGVRAGCTADNNWCDAPELSLRDEGCSCRAARGGDGLLALALLGVAAAVIRLRRRALVLTPLLLLPRGARADEHKPAFQPCPDGPSEGIGKGPIGKGAEKILGEPRPGFGVHGSLAASFDSPAFAVTLGARYRITDLWLVGLNAEWNPWGSPLERVRAGALNAYASGIRRWPIRSDTYALRSTLHAGTSTILFDLYGVPRGTTGLFLGVSLVGIEVKLGRGATMIFEPAEFDVPAPQLRGLFAYTQYRFTVALQWGAAGY